MKHSEWISERDLAAQIARSYYLRTGIQLDPEVFLVELQRKFNPYHDPDNGRFTFAPGGGAGQHSGTANVRPRSGLAPYPVRIELPPRRPVDVNKKPADTNADRAKPPVIRFRYTPGIDLPDEVVSKANVLSDAVRTATGHELHVTSGRRPPQRQAEAMYDNYVRRTDPGYANYRAAEEVHRAFQAGSRSGLGRKHTVALMTQVLVAQTKRGVYLSRHMRSGAIDIRTPSAEVLNAIRKHPSAQSVGVESNHIHIQFH